MSLRSVLELVGLVCIIGPLFAIGELLSTRTPIWVVAGIWAACAVTGLFLLTLAQILDLLTQIRNAAVQGQGTEKRSNIA